VNEPALNLLVVDWDYFFPNPAYAANPTEESLMYLWDHAEAPAYLSPLVWSGRASAFIRSGMELPRAEGYEGFWNRFRFNPDGVSVLYGDSNLHAGRIMPSSLGLDEEYETADAWARVTLYDAHHDSGYKSTGTLEEWRATGKVSCEDWMLVHHDAGSRLEVRYPTWRREVGQVEPEPLVPVDRQIDDGRDPDVEYHAVYVCRSGAWVPPWCDDQFTEFMDQAPCPWPTLMDPEAWVHPRPDALAEAHQHATAADLFDRLTAGGGLDPAVAEELRRQREGHRG
jgi:hypothetical protein